MRVARAMIVALLVTTSCVGLLGIDDDQKSAVQKLCKCPQAEPYYGSPAACTADLERRLEGVTETARAQWMQNFSKKCAGPSCQSALDCLAVKPTCLDLGEDCGGDGKACCSQQCDDQGDCT
jgi:hypothetical protein